MKDDKDDEAKDDEQTKKSGKRRKQMARKGLHKVLIKMTLKIRLVGEQEESVIVISKDGSYELYRIVMNKYGDEWTRDELERFTMSIQHKNWLVQEQTALGKDFSNPFYG
ncbi:hypothetical protein Tco_0173449 [Tanacetum coccineum]